MRRVGGHAGATPTPFTEALIRLKEANGSYVQAAGAVKVAEETLFQTRIEMPANLVEGDYAAEFFLVRDFGVVYSGETLIRVEKTGIERWLYNLSVAEPLLYGHRIGAAGAGGGVGRGDRVSSRAAVRSYALRPIEPASGAGGEFHSC